MLEFQTQEEVNEYLKGKGMGKNYTYRGRQYWWFANGKDVMMDHSASVDKFSGIFYVADFTI